MRDVNISDARQSVHQRHLTFYGESWPRWLETTSNLVDDLLKKGYGVLNVDFEKAQDNDWGISCVVMITYWDKP